MDFISDAFLFSNIWDAFFFFFSMGFRWFNLPCIGVNADGWLAQPFDI